MGQLFRCAGLGVLSLALLLPTFAAQDAKTQDAQKGDAKDAKKVDDLKKKDLDAKKGDDKKADPKKGPDEPKEKVVFSAKYPGKITELDNNDFTVQVAYKVAEANQDAQRQMTEHQQRLLQLQMELARKNQREAIDRQRDIQNLLGQIAQTQRNLIRYKDVTADLKLRLAETVKVRTSSPPLDYDDKGNVKKYTAKELAALRGTSGLPGYKADKDLLRAGQLVEVYIAAPKGASNTKAGVDPKTGKSVAKTKGGVDELLASPGRPEVVMVVIQQEPTK